MKVDVTLLSMPGEDAEMHKRCRASLEKEPINLVEGDGVEGDLREARKRVYSKCTADLISYVDYDDVVMPGAYQKCIEVMQANPNLIGCYTWEIVEFGAARSKFYFPNWTKTTFIDQGYSRVFVVRREVMLDVLDRYYDLIPPLWGEDRSMLALTSLYGDWQSIDFYGHHRYQHFGSISVIKTIQHKGNGKLFENLTPVRNLIYSKVATQA